MQEVRGELGARLQAEQSLLRRLQLQHGQQGALEDKGVSLLHAHTRHFTVTLPLHYRHITATLPLQVSVQQTNPSHDRYTAVT